MDAADFEAVGVEHSTISNASALGDHATANSSASANAAASGGGGGEAGGGGGEGDDAALGRVEARTVKAWLSLEAVASNGGVLHVTSLLFETLLLERATWVDDGTRAMEEEQSANDKEVVEEGRRDDGANGGNHGGCAAGGGGGGFSWLLSTTSFGSRQRLGRSLLRLHMLIDQPAAPAPVSSHLLGDADDSGANGASAAAATASSSNGVLPVSPAANGTASGHLWGRLGSGDGADAGRKVAWRSRPADIQLGLAELSLDAAAPSHVTMS